MRAAIITLLNRDDKLHKGGEILNAAPIFDSLRVIVRIVAIVAPIAGSG